MACSEFAHISGPVIEHERLHRAVGKLFRLFRTGFFLEKIIDKKRNIFPVVSQRGNTDCDHIQTIEKIVAETSGARFLLQVFVCRGENTNVGAQLVCPADSAEITGLKKPQKFRLDDGADIADFIEEQRAAVRDFDEPRLRGIPHW